VVGNLADAEYHRHGHRGLKKSVKCQRGTKIVTEQKHKDTSRENASLRVEGGRIVGGQSDSCNSVRGWRKRKCSKPPSEREVRDLGVLGKNEGTMRPEEKKKKVGAKVKGGRQAGKG